MTDDLWLQRRVNDLKIGFIFLTRLPLPIEQPIAKGELSQALWTAPVVGAVVGLIGAGVYGLAQSLHLPPLPRRGACGCSHRGRYRRPARGRIGRRRRRLWRWRDARAQARDHA